MPELPEVETIVRELSRNIINAEIIDIKVNYKKIIDSPTSTDFINIIKKQKIIQISRRGKYIIFHLSKGFFLIIHLRMTGKIIINKIDIKPTKHDHIIFYLNNNKNIFYNDTRKFGRFYLTKNKNDIIGKLGPEPLGNNYIFSEFQNKLILTSRKIKSLLLDQHFVAGLGNIYTDEALWEARIHPEQQANLISSSKQKALFNAIKNVLQKGINNNGTSLGDGQGNYTSTNKNRGSNQYSLNVFARTNKACPNCTTIIKKIVVAQRGTHFCPNCQKLSV